MTLVAKRYILEGFLILLSLSPFGCLMTLLMVWCFFDSMSAQMLSPPLDGSFHDGEVLLSQLNSGLLPVCSFVPLLLSCLCSSSLVC